MSTLANPVKVVGTFLVAWMIVAAASSALLALGDSQRKQVSPGERSAESKIRVFYPPLTTSKEHVEAEFAPSDPNATLSDLSSPADLSPSLGQSGTPAANSGGTNSAQNSSSVDTHKQSRLSVGSADPLYYMVKLGIYADLNYCNAVPNWNLQLLKIVQDVNSIYNAQENTMLLRVDGPRCISGSDSWSSDTTAILSQFGSWCAGDSSCAAAEVADLISGKDLSYNGDTSAIGAGYEPGKYSVLEGTWGTSYGRMIVSSHEIGHNFWGDHAYADTWWDWGCFWTAGTIMHTPYETDCSMKNYFSAANGKAIKGQIRAVSTTWLPYTEQTSTSNDGFYAVKWWVRYPRIPTVNSLITVHFYLVNPTANTVTFSDIFVGCRIGGSNCDFGYSGQVTLPPQTSYELTASRQVSSVGIWQFWPAYWLNGGFGPYQWSMVQVAVVGVPVGQYAGPDTSSDGVKLTNFKIWAPSATVHVGDTVFVEFTYTNTLTGYLDFDPYGIGVGLRDPSDANKDFGYTILRLWGSQSTSWPYDEWTILTASKVLTSTGSWIFWPAYYLGHWGPYKWHAITISVVA